MYIVDELVQTLATAKKIVPYIDLPLQHISDEMLRRMSRRVTRAQTVDLLARLRGRIPNLTMRTTFITGFPGETEEQFQELCDFVAEQKFERAGVFTYSFEPDTPAARLDGHLPEDVKEDRRARLMAVQQASAFAWSAAQVGKQMDVILDQPVAGEKHVWIGRSHADAPDVDAVVYVTGDKRQKLSAGQFTRCEIVAARDYDLIGAAVGKPW
jgi:ribosomal protein S12 methylthiotransferase